MMRKLLGLVLSGCVGIESGPKSPEEAFEWAELSAPAQLSELRYTGEKGIDALVLLQFVLPDAATATRYVAGFGCTPTPIQRSRDNPFDYKDPGHPEWLVHEPPPEALACRTQPGAGVRVQRGVRLDPLPDGRVRVQITANTL